MGWILIILLVLFVTFITWLVIESHNEEITFARLTNRPSNVVMRYSDTKLAEFKKGDKGQIFDIKPITKVINNYPNKYFNVVFEDGKKLLVSSSYIKWVSYIETLYYTQEEEKNYLD